MGKTIEHAAQAAHGHGDPLFAAGLEAINKAAGFVILFALGVACLNAAALVLSHVTGSPMKMLLALTQRGKHVSLDRIKLETGRLIAFSLLLLVAADVIETLVHSMHDTSMEDLYKMCLMGALRTGLAYFLGKELEEIAEHIEHSEHDHSHGHGEKRAPAAAAGKESKKTK